MSYENKGTIFADAIVSMSPDASGNFVASGAADHVQIQAAIDYVNLIGGGIVLIRVGTYDIGVTITLYKRVRLVGSSIEEVTLSVSAAINCITVDSTNTHAWYEIGYLYIDMGNNVGHGVYSLYPSAQTYTKPDIHHLCIVDVNVASYGIYFYDAFHINLRCIVVEGGNGIRIEKRATGVGRDEHLGNSYMEDIHILLYDNDTFGIYIVSTADYIMNLIEWHRVQVIALPQGGPPTGTTGIYLGGVEHITFYDLDVETCMTNVHLESLGGGRDCFHNHFFSTYIYSANADYGWYLQLAVHGTVIIGGKTYVNADGYGYRDRTQSDGKENNISNYKFVGTGTLHWGRKTTIHNMAYDTPYSLIATPFGAVEGQNCIHPTQGGAAVPVSGTIYYARVLNYIINVSNGVVSNIQLYDKGGNQVIGGITSCSAMLVPRGFRFEVTWSGSPTVEVFPWGD